MSHQNGYATREDFLAFTKRRFKDVTLWNGAKARIRSLTEGEFAEADSGNIDLRKGGLNPEGVRRSNARLIAYCVCDAEGECLFTPSDVPKLMQIDAAVVQPLVREIREFCGLKENAEDIRKNSEATDDGGLPCTSAEPSPAASMG